MLEVVVVLEFSELDSPLFLLKLLMIDLTGDDMAVNAISKKVMGSVGKPSICDTIAHKAQRR